MESSVVDSVTPSLPSLDLIAKLRAAVNDPDLPLSKRYRALFGLKHHACLSPPTELTLPAIKAIASAFGTQSALLKHEVAYCLGQTRNLATSPYLRAILEDRSEDSMVRHESAEALGALGDQDSLKLLQERRDDAKEEDVVRETCEIAVGRLEWEDSELRKSEKSQQRYLGCDIPLSWNLIVIVLLHLLILLHPFRAQISQKGFHISKPPFSIRLSPSSNGIEPCLRFEISHHHHLFQLRSLLFKHLRPALQTLLRCSGMKSLLYLDSYHILRRYLHLLPH